MKTIPYATQNISAEDIALVGEVLRSDFLTQGPWVEKFEKALAQYCQARYAVVVANATCGLQLAYQAAGLAENDWLFTVANTFVATSNAALYCRAKVDFIDIDPQTYNLAIADLATKLEKAKIKPKIIVPVHFAGLACQMQEIKKLADQYGCKVIEDASHAIGARYLNEPIGNCRFSDMAVMSFHAIKIITSAEGGVILTNNKDYYQKLLLLRSHGITKDSASQINPTSEPWYSEQLELGYNYRLNDLQCALGFSQLQRIEKNLKARQEVAQYYNKELAGLPLAIHPEVNYAQSSHHLYVIRLKLAELKQTKLQVVQALKTKNILTNVNYIPVYHHPYYRNHGFENYSLAATEKYYQEALSLPMYYGLNLEQQAYVVASLKSVLLK